MHVHVCGLKDDDLYVNEFTKLNVVSVMLVILILLFVLGIFS